MTFKKADTPFDLFVSDTRKPKYGRIQDSILNHIREGDWAPGDRIPPERELARIFAASVGDTGGAVSDNCCGGVSDWLYRWAETRRRLRPDRGSNIAAGDNNTYRRRNCGVSDCRCNSRSMGIGISRRSGRDNNMEPDRVRKNDFAGIEVRRC